MSALADLPAVVERFMRDPEFRGPGVVAVSGGPDSVALLRALLDLRGGPAIVMAHVNHTLRGAESDGDEGFVKALQAKLAKTYPGLSLRSTRIDIGDRARSEGESVETTARQYRYAWLENVARETGAAWIATGHTADDQAETVLHRLLRGTGLKGLCGIPARRELAPGLLLIRPLLGIRRQTVLTYLAQLDQDFRDDSSNNNLAFTRNRLRHELLPHLAAHYSPAIVDLLCRLAGQALEIKADQEQRAATLLRESELPRAGTVLVFDVAALGRAPRHLVREMFRLVWSREGWPQGALGFDDWDRLAGQIDEADDSTLQLAGQVRVRRRGKVLQLQASRERQRPEE